MVNTTDKQTPIKIGKTGRAADELEGGGFIAAGYRTENKMHQFHEIIIKQIKLNVNYMISFTGII